MSATDYDERRPGRYLTDGTQLNRFITPAGRPPHGGLVELENCRSLHHVLVSWHLAARMRAVARDGLKRRRHRKSTADTWDE